MENNNKYLHPIISGSRILLDGNIFLAPMAGFTDQAFRHICLENSADMCFTEMVSCEALVRNSRKTGGLLDRADNENDYAAQIFCSSPETAAEAVKIIASYKPVMIDLNCGCPVPKIIKSGSGCALMTEPEKIGRIVKALREASDIPVSVKLRSGWDNSRPAFISCAVAAAENGAAMVTLHPRTKVQGYSGEADWNKIRELKKEIDIPVIGSGDLFTARDCIDMMDSTGCDGIMIARGAVGNPEIFHDTKTLALTGELPRLTAAEYSVKKIENAEKHIYLSEKYFDNKSAVNELKKHLCSYIKGIKDAASFRSRIVRCSSMSEYRQVLAELRSSL